MTGDELSLSVVIPAYNEEARIGPTLGRVLDYLEAAQPPSEVLVVVDGSRDGTARVVRGIAANRPGVAVLDNAANAGKGFSVRRGVLAARGRFVLFSDADLSTPIEEVERFIQLLESGYDVAIASRALPESKVERGAARETMSQVFSFLVRRLVLPGIHDSQCGFKCFRGDVARRLFARQQIGGFAFDVEILWIARKLGYRIAEVPVTWTDDPRSKVRPARDSLAMVRDLLRIRLLDRRGAYAEAARDPAAP